MECTPYGGQVDGDSSAWCACVNCLFELLGARVSERRVEPFDVVDLVDKPSDLPSHLSD